MSEVSFNVGKYCYLLLITCYPSNLRGKHLLQNPSELEDWFTDLNPNSKTVIPEAFAVPILKNAKLGQPFQFERLGKRIVAFWLCFIMAMYPYVHANVCI